MKNKIILILLTIFIVGSITSITAYSSIHKEADRNVQDNVWVDETAMTGSINRDHVISGNLYDLRTGKGVPNAKLAITRGDGFNDPFVNFGYTTTNENGDYSYQVEREDQYGFPYSVEFNWDIHDRHPGYVGYTICRIYSFS